jgi:hypothetical protein
MFNLREIPTSSRIHSIGYDPTQQVLVVRFKDRAGVPDAKVRNYRDVPADVADSFLNAPSAGKYFAFEVHGRFDCDVIAA